MLKVNAEGERSGRLMAKVSVAKEMVKEKEEGER